MGREHKSQRTGRGQTASVPLKLASCHGLTASCVLIAVHSASCANRTNEGQPRAVPSASSANDTSEWQPRESMSQSTIDQLKPGMDLTQVHRICGQPYPSDSPLYHYPADDGGQYLLHFLPTYEVDRPPGFTSNDFVLVAVTYVSAEFYGRDLGNYVLPERVRGSRCTGVKIEDEPTTRPGRSKVSG
jgi:hypothetical protein